MIPSRPRRTPKTIINDQANRLIDRLENKIYLDENHRRILLAQLEILEKISKAMSWPLANRINRAILSDLAGGGLTKSPEIGQPVGDPWDFCGG